MQHVGSERGKMSPTCRKAKRSVGLISRRIGRRKAPSFNWGAIVRQRRVGAFAAGQAVADDADVVAALGLAVGEIEDMAENAADRRARHMHDLEADGSPAMIRTSVR